jgi:hypothetical protein
MEEFTTKHPADARPDELTHGQRITRGLMPELAALQDQRKCVMCREPKTPEQIATWSEAGQREWNISGMCEPCFDKAFEEEADIPVLNGGTVAEYRTPEGLAADAASTTETYGNACYFCGGDVAGLGPNIILNHPGDSSTDETCCQACIDRVLGAMVKSALDNARESGYVFGANSAEDLAMDIARYDGDLDLVDAKDLLPHVRAWLEAPVEG